MCYIPEIILPSGNLDLDLYMSNISYNLYNFATYYTTEKYTLSTLGLSTVTLGTAPTHAFTPSDYFTAKAIDYLGAF